MADNGDSRTRALPYIIGGGLGLVAVASLVLWIIATNPGVGSRRGAAGPRATPEDLARWDGLATQHASMETRNIEVILPDGDSGGWVTSAESVVVPVDESLRLQRVVTTWLRHGAAVTRSARLLSAHVDDDRRAYVNLSSELLTGPPLGLTGELEFVISLAKTIRANLPTMVDVQLLVNGQETDTIGGQLDISAPLRLARFAEME
jgi:hypothetical protein